ncbi:MAG: stalk domain-containing protein [Symbiobacterium sp.]|uniref:stalk domain-containing protein n=1 Tax=Symbiobacterium sp. TaxID=1971213 RepID=UPI003464CF65
MHRSRQIAAALALSACLGLLPAPASAATYSVISNGVTLTNTQPEMVNGQLMVAVRPYAESLGYKVSYDDKSKMITVYKTGYWLTLWLGNSLSFQNDKAVWAPVAPYLKNGQTMVPAWWLAVRLGADVSFSGSTLTVSNGYKLPVTSTGSATSNTAGANGGSASSGSSGANTGSTASTGAGQAGATNRNPRPDSLFADPTYVFPFPQGATYSGYTDTMGDSRWWNGETFGHEGTDIVSPKGTPIVAVASGKVVRYGWNTLGGYRVTVELDDHPGYYFYYAHLSGYAPGLYLGAHVKTGQLLGYVGSTGEGPEGTSGKFVDHLHFGIYDSDWKPMNSYLLLKYWEGNKAKL